MRAERSDWYLPALIVGTALAAFFLGSATTMWLGAAPVSVTARGAALAQGAAAALGKNESGGQKIAPAASPAGPAQATPAPALRSAQPPVAGAASLAQPAGSPASAPGDTETSGPAGPAARAAQAPATQAPASGSAQPNSAAAVSAAQPGASPASAPGPASPGASPAGEFGLQLGAFLNAAKAKLLVDQLTARGYSPAPIDAADGYGRTWHYVRLGAFGDERAAALAASDLLERAGIGAAVVRLSAANAGR
jgi:cell division septation protein DedD